MKNYMLLVICFVVSLSVYADAKDDKFKLGNKENPTAVSGYAGAWQELGTGDPYQGLQQILWGEKTDDPCGLYIKTSHLNNFSTLLDPLDFPEASIVRENVYGDYDIYEHPVGEVGNFPKYVDLDCDGDTREVNTVGIDKYIYKLNVCTTDKKNSTDNKLKGLRIWARTLIYKDYKDGESPVLINEPTPIEAVHKAHCDDWHKPVACGAGEIVSRIRVHHNDIDHRDWATGISLICKKVKMKPKKTKATLTPVQSEPMPIKTLP